MRRIDSAVDLVFRIRILRGCPARRAVVGRWDDPERQQPRVIQGGGGADLVRTARPVLRQTRDSNGVEPLRVGPALDVAGLHRYLRGGDDGRRARADVERGPREDPTKKNGGQIQMG